MSKIATIGFFDGVHKGHRYLFRQLDAIGAARGLAPLIVTFAEHPREVLQSDYLPQLLTTAEERNALLSAFGEVLMLPFADIRAMTAAQFMDYLHTRHDVSVLLMGYDHRFGSDRLKKASEYRRIGEKAGIEVLTVGEYMEDEWHVSSTEIRAALENGNIALANELLGRPYTLRGTVVHGKGLGHTIGFPTANIAPNNAQKIIPKAGVYVVSVRSTAFTWTPAMLNIGPEGIETYIPSFSGDIYGEQMDVRFLRYVREEKRFENLEELREQIKEDVDSSLRPA